MVIQKYAGSENTLGPGTRWSWERGGKIRENFLPTVFWPTNFMTQRKFWTNAFQDPTRIAGLKTVFDQVFLKNVWSDQVDFQKPCVATKFFSKTYVVTKYFSKTHVVTNYLSQTYVSTNYF